jgi:DNA-binding MarR family transcriptional regulator
MDGILAFYRLSRSLRNTELPRDLTWERLSTLSVVAQREPVSISELSVVEEVTAPTISRMISALQERDLVRCVLNRNDGRSVLVTSTAKGRMALEKGMARTLQQVAEMLARFEPSILESMANMIRQVRESKS